MTSSQLKSENERGAASASHFPFAWRAAPSVPGPDTIVTSAKTTPQVPQSMPADALEAIEHGDLVQRLFPTSADAADVRGLLLGHFSIQKQIGIGGMGAVFLAIDERLRREVALKVLAPSLSADPASVRRFQNEARAAAQLDHDNIARAFFSGEYNGLHYIAYEYVPGTNLRDVIRARGKLDPAEAVNYTIQLAAALSHMSAAGIVHRDIKPSNVLITPNGRAKLVDLGLARHDSPNGSAELTVPGTTLGTFDYISPEQAKDPRNVDVRSDIYSLGCTLYHMLTGEPPYPEGTILQKLLDHKEKIAPDPTKKNRRVSASLSAVVRRMMASDLRRRYANPGELLRDLLNVARELGSGAVPIDGRVWLTAVQGASSFWTGQFGWLVTAAALIAVVVGMDRMSWLTDSKPVTNGSDVRLAGNDSLKTQEPRTGRNAGDASVAEEKSSGADGARKAVAPDSNKAVAAADKRPFSPTSSIDQEPFSRPPFTPFESPGLALLTEYILNKGTPSTAKGPVVPPYASENTSSDVHAGSEGASQETKTNPNTPTSPKVASTGSAQGSTNSSPVGGGITSGATGSEAPAGVISVVNGKTYDSLEAACAEAKDGTIIELRYSGKRGSPERPIRLSSKKNLIIRGAVGFRPVIEFLATATPNDPAQSRAITVNGGSLELVNLDIIHTISEKAVADRWALFSLERPEKLQLHGVTITMFNPGAQPTSLIEQVAAPAQGLRDVGMMKNGVPSVPPDIQISESLLRGECDLITLRDSVPARYQLKDVAVAVQGALFHSQCQSESMSAQDGDRITLELDHSTCLLGGGLIVTGGSDHQVDRTPPLMVIARNNIFSTSSGRPLVAMKNAGELMDTQLRFFWNGNNNYYDGLSQFWQLGDKNTAATGRTLNFEEWKVYWGNNEGIGSINAPVAWQVAPTPQRDWGKVSVGDLELDPLAKSNPAVNGASDGKDAGATLTKLPVAWTDERPVGSEDALPSNE